jgi:hypothetical protein
MAIFYFCCLEENKYDLLFVTKKKTLFGGAFCLNDRRLYTNTEVIMSPPALSLHILSKVSYHDVLTLPLPLHFVCSVHQTFFFFFLRYWGLNSGPTP